jgi:hypothetical protein
MVIRVTTQYVENYGHRPEGVSFRYWKPKQGDDYYVLGSEGRPYNAVAKVYMVLQERTVTGTNPKWIEYINGWEDLGSEGLIPKKARDADRVFILDGLVNPRQPVKTRQDWPVDAVDDLLTKTYGNSA